MRPTHLFTGIAVMFALTGCVPVPKGRPTAATVPTPVTVTAAPPSVNDGSLWQGDSRANGSLTSDIRARRKGDIVTVLVVENVNATRQRNTTTSKEQDMTGSVTQLFFPGLGTLGAQAATKTAAAVAGQNANLTYKSARNFNGGGTVTDTGTVTATVSTQVVDVMPNGNLVLSGSKQVTISGEVQTVTLTGIARADDVTPANTVASTSLAEARVHITGDGPLDDAQRRTLVARVLDWVNLF